jgi:hypothetical protein
MRPVAVPLSRTRTVADLCTRANKPRPTDRDGFGEQRGHDRSSRRLDRGNVVSAAWPPSAHVRFSLLGETRSCSCSSALSRRPSAPFCCGVATTDTSIGTVSRKDEAALGRCRRPTIDSPSFVVVQKSLERNETKDCSTVRTIPLDKCRTSRASVSSRRFVEPGRRSSSFTVESEPVALFYSACRP